MTAGCEKWFQANRTACLVVALVLIVWSIGCGKKGPPRLPDAPEMPEITDLSYRLEGDRAVLEWSMSEDRKPDITGFYVYRSLSALSEAPCEGCPVVFEKIAIVSADIAAERGGLYTYRDAVIEGYRHAYKVSVYRDGAGGAKGSNVIRFEVPSTP